MRTTHTAASLAAALACGAAAFAQGDRKLPPQGVLLPDLTPGYVLIEGDIQVRLDHYLAYLVRGESAFGDVSFWPNGVVPFAFVTSGPGAVSITNQFRLFDAMTTIEQWTGVDFQPIVGFQPNSILVRSSSFNNSPVGVQGGAQIINIASWENQIIIIHELFHSLGFWHEQSRPDRNGFVTINVQNICGAPICPAGTGAGQCCLCVNGNGGCIPCDFNFEIRTNARSYGPYDFDSMMHYGRADFSCNGQDTITVNAPWNALWQNTIGQRNHMSYFDRITCRGIYPRFGDRWLDRNWNGSSNGTFLEPWNLPFISAVAFTADGGTLFVRPGHYSAIGVYNLPRTIEGPEGAVTLGN